jgi:membrane-associated protease RseP (regulator of RpoE activity)
VTLLLDIAAFIVLIMVVVGVHEGGHFLTAKASGIRVDEFAIGFGPRILQRQRGETVYAVRALPLGGFVKMPGMSELEQDDGGERGFMRAPVSRQIIVILAGVTFNFIFAGLLFGIISIPGHDPQVFDTGGAYAAGLRNGDLITSVMGQPVDTTDSKAQSDALRTATGQTHGAPIQVSYRRASDGTIVQTTVRPYLSVADFDSSQPVTASNGKPLNQFVVDTIDGKPVATGDPATLLGAGRPVQVIGHAVDDRSVTVTATLSRAVTDQNGDATIGRITAAWRIGYVGGYEGRSVASALLHGFTDLPKQVATQVRAVYDVLTTPNSGGVSNFQGPIGIAHDTATATQAGWLTFLGFMALISLSLGIVNLLPIPPFDGGRFAIIVAGALARRRLAPRLEMGFIVAGVMLILTLFVVITLNDIRSF